jgi:putative transposase
LIDAAPGELSVRRQCELLGLNRSTWYYEAVPESVENLALMRWIDEQYLRTPFYGSRRMTVVLGRAGHEVNRKRIQRLMRLMGLEAIYPKPRTTIARTGHKIYPYLLRGVAITRPDQVWSTDITYVPLSTGFLYLVAVLDWFSRHVLAWRLSNSLDGSFCLEALEEALRHGQPEIFNTDQGVQFTSKEFTGRLERSGIAISMDGRGRALDNVFVERLWRTVKYEDLYLHGYTDGAECHEGLTKFFRFYSHERPHQALDDRTPWEVYREARQMAKGNGRQLTTTTENGSRAARSRRSGQSAEQKNTTESRGSKVSRPGVGRAPLRDPFAALRVAPLRPAHPRSARRSPRKRPPAQEASRPNRRYKRLAQV